MTALVIGIPMLVILAESETGSALVYVGFIFVMYREGFSGWWLFAIGMAILLFILTLVTSAYTAILVLIGVVLFINALNEGKLSWELGANIAAFLLLCFLPWIMEKAAGPESFLEKVKPLYVLIGICLRRPSSS